MCSHWLPEMRLAAALLALLAPQVWSASDSMVLPASAVLPCQIVANRGVDSIAEYRNGNDEIIRYAGTWRGREGSYLLLADSRAHSVRLRPLEAPTLSEQISLRSCPPQLPMAAAQALADAVDLKLQRYFGQAVDSARIQQLLQTAMSGFHQAGLPIWQAAARNELAEHLLNLGQLEAALQHYEQLLQQYQTLADQPGVAATENLLGLTRWRLGHLQQAEQHYHRAMQLREQLQDQLSLAGLANNLGLLAMQRGDHAEALRQYELALTVFQGKLDLRREIDNQQAMAMLQREDSNVPSSALNTLNNMALLLDGSGQSLLAERYWRNVLAFDGLVDQQRVVEQSRRNLAQMLQRQGRLDEALLLLTAALDYFETTDVALWQAETLLNLSRLYALLGDQAAASQHLQQALTLNVDDASTRGKLLLNQGEYLRQQGSFAAAKNEFEQAAGQYQQADMRIEMLSVRAELAYLLLLQGDAARALSLLRTTQQELSDLDAQPEAAITLSRLGQAQLASGDLAAARQSLQLALQQLDQSADVLAEFETLDRLAQLEQSAGDRQAALRINARAIALAETLRSGQLPALRQAEFLAARRSLYDRQVAALLDDGQPREAWRVAEQARARSLQELRLERGGAQQRAQQQPLLDQRARAVTQLHQLTLTPGAEQGAHHASAVLAARREIDRIETLLRSDDRGLLNNPVTAQVSLEKLQSLLHPGQLLLSYYLRGDELLVWVIDQTSVRDHQLGASEAIAAQVRSLLQQAQHPRNARGRIEQLAAELGQSLLAPAAAQLAAASEVLVQADAVLNSLPFALLTYADAQGNGHALADKPLLSVPSAAVLAQSAQLQPAVAGQDQASSAGHSNGDESNITPSTAAGSGPQTMLVLADPDWEGADEPSPLYPRNSLVGRLLRDAGSARLPGTRREAEAIAALQSSTRVDLRLGRVASSEFITDGGLADYQLVHIASHGLVDLQYPMLSSLLLANEHGNGPALLRPHDILGLDLQARLVVLSGCETGQGRIIAGDGAMSLARPFLIAGAEQVLSSLWKVDDHRTAMFMQRFYRYLLVDRLDTAHALQQTQAWMRRQPATAHAYFWAGFVLSSAVQTGRSLAAAD